MYSRRCSILLVEDNPSDALLFRASIEAAAAGAFSIDHVERLSDAENVLAQHAHDIVLFDLGLPDTEGLTGLVRMRAQAPHIPMVVLTSADDDHLAHAALAAGAQDYFVKGQIVGAMLTRGIRHAIERHRAARALMESEARHRQLFETISHGVIYHSATGEIIDANPAAERILGLTFAQMQGRMSVDPRWRATREDGSDFPGNEHPAAIALRTGLPQGPTLMGVFNPVDLRHRWILVHAFPEFRPGDAAPYRVCANFTDVTQLRAAEEAAVVQRQVLETVYGHLPLMIALFNPQREMVWVNRCWLKTLGYSWDDMQQQRAIELMYPDAVCRARAFEFIETTNAEWGDFCTRTRDSRVLNTRWAHVLLPDGNSIGIGQDVTEHVQAEQALRVASKRLTAVLDTSPVAIIVVDTNTNVMLWNRTAEEMFGWRADEVMGRPYPITSPAGVPGPAHMFSDAIAGQSSRGVNLQRYTRDGRLLDLTLWNAQIRDADGNISALVGIFADMTAQRQLEQQLQHAQKMDAFGRMAGGIAHDFNNILTAISGNTDLLLAATRAEDTLQCELTEIRRGVERAATLTRQLLAFSRRQVARPRVMSVDHAITDLSGMLTRLIGAHIELNVDSSAAGNVFADNGQFEQVLVNLVLNARDAIAGAGAITVTASNVTLEPPFSASFAFAPEAGDYVMVEVKDTGHGMPAALLEHIFEPFFTTKEQGKGTGLGLSIVYGLVTQAGGALAVESVAGTGSCFRVYLPRVEAPVQAEFAPTLAAPRSRCDETVLLVEDEAAVRRVAARILEKQGYRVLVAEDGAEALRLLQARSTDVDLLVTDLVMPRMNGRELVERVHATRPHTRTLFISGYSNDVVGNLSAIAGCAGLLEKPFGPEDLLRAVRDALDTVVTTPIIL